MTSTVSKDDKPVAILFRLYALSNWRTIKLGDGYRIKLHSTAFRNRTLHFINMVRYFVLIF
jgi:hypothetical protein